MDRFTKRTHEVRRKCTRIISGIGMFTFVSLALMALTLILASGCATGPTNPHSNSWHHDSKEDMYRLMGQATLDALHQYDEYYNPQPYQHQATPRPLDKGLELYLEDRNKG